jgi:hypothetical protein
VPEFVAVGHYLAVVCAKLCARRAFAAIFAKLAHVAAQVSAVFASLAPVASKLARVRPYLAAVCAKLSSLAAVYVSLPVRLRGGRRRAREERRRERRATEYQLSHL